MTIAAIPLLQHDLEVAPHHLGDHVLEAGRVRPAEPLASLAGVAEEEVHLGWPEITGVDAHHGLARSGVEADFVGALAPPFDPAADDAEGDLDQLAYSVRLAGGEHKIVRLRILENAPHAI